jgi:predicted enzyme related to lactoylglutathione lyase
MVLHPITVNTILYCRQWHDMVRFYRDRLQLPVNFSNDWFVEFHLTEKARLSIADERRSSVKSAAGNGITITLEVEDIATVHKRLLAMGLKPNGIRKHPWNALIFHLFDPDSNRIEVWQSMKNGGLS